MVGKALISLFGSNSTFHLEGEIQLANVAFLALEDGEPRVLEPLVVLPPPSCNEGSAGGQEGLAKSVVAPLDPPFECALAFTQEDPKVLGPGVKSLPKAYNGSTSRDGNSPRPSKDESSYSLDTPSPKQPVRFMGASTPVGCGKVLIPPLSPHETRKAEASHSSPSIR
uniref:Uncharacterized protein n=1 Tax=Oryza punctata TaxID=4537 RepID=A0A0E0JJ92_ORYPU